MKHSRIFIGSAGWSIRSEFAHDFPDEGTHLERYARRFNAVEINSSFKSEHRESTYQRWAESADAHFRFSVKLPQLITHQLQLQGSTRALRAFIASVKGLGKKLSVLLVQLPPQLRFNIAEARRFFKTFRQLYLGHIVVEARNETWFAMEAEKLLAGFDVSRAIVDPAPIPAMSTRLASNKIQYYRLHGSPRVYHSNYPTAYLQSLAGELLHSAEQSESWCIFDNTAAGHATANAQQLSEMLGPESRMHSKAIRVNT